MCGIAGVIDLDNKIDVMALRDMTQIIKHRGPDDEGFFLFNGIDVKFACGSDTIDELKNELENIEHFDNKTFSIGFGHRRLSILDLSRNGHQPMMKHERIITYNGEVYNYKELRSTLEEAGYKFNTSGDTEVILSAYDYWGGDCVKHFNGMWAFAILDHRTKTVFCSRDRFGVKPFYYYKKDYLFVFGSEIKQLLAYGIKAKVNEKMLHTFLLTNFSDISNETFFKDIYVLEAGHNILLEYSNNSLITLTKQRFWDLEFHDSFVNVNYKDNCEEIGEYLNNAVKLRLRSDVPVGSCLSGGLDSSSIVTLAINELEKQGIDPKKFKTYTSTVEGNINVDETYYSDIVVNDTGCTSIKVSPTFEKVNKDLEKLVWHQEEPFTGFSIFSGWLVMEKAKDMGTKVLLDGQGGDEVLLGYENYYSYPIIEYIKKGKWKNAIQLFYNASKCSTLSPSLLFIHCLYFGIPNLKELYKKRVLSDFINRDFLKRYSYPQTAKEYRNIKNIKDLHVKELKQGICRLLKWEDKNSMAHSIETRLPFLDYLFVQRAINSSTVNKLNGGWLKSLLRGYMQDKMSKEVVYRTNKFGFPAPDSEIIDSFNDEFISELLSNPKSGKYFNMEYVKKCFDRKMNTSIRFKFLMIETWLKVYDIDLS
jgi:asparagine synthase (glutamine-hydrolysing)